MPRSRSSTIFPTIDFEELARRPPSLKQLSKSISKRDIYYHNSYHIILKQFGRLKLEESDDDFDQIQIALMIVYSWMGRGVLTSFAEQFDAYNHALPALRKAREQGFVNEDELNKIAALVNDSVIASSKFLHFLAPKSFAIWDANVSIALGLGTYRVGSNERYAEYIEWIRAAPIMPETVTKVATALRLPRDSAELRCKEVLLFRAGTADKASASYVKGAIAKRP